MSDTKNVPNLANRLVEYVAEHDYVSFAQLAYDFEEFRNGTIDLMHAGPNHSNIVIWTGLTKIAAEAYALAEREARIDVVPCSSALVYLLDGRALKLPLVKAARHYKRPHWCPVVLRPGLGPGQQGQSTIEFALAA